MPYVEANHKNEPLLPRSASFGSQSQLQSQLQKLTAKASNVVSSVCQGEEAGVKLACLNGGLAGLAIGLLGVLNPFAVLTPLHLLTCLYLLSMSLVVLALEVEVPLLEPFYEWVGVWMRALTTMTGRGVMYLVLGSLAAGLGDWLAILAGLALMGAGAACLWFVSRFPSTRRRPRCRCPLRRWPARAAGAATMRGCKMRARHSGGACTSACSAWRPPSLWPSAVSFIRHWTSECTWRPSCGSTRTSKAPSMRRASCSGGWSRRVFDRAPTHGVPHR